MNNTSNVTLFSKDVKIKKGWDTVNRAKSMVRQIEQEPNFNKRIQMLHEVEKLLDNLNWISDQ